MADALCGPSNALQNFQKHTAGDRTLQQDRLTSRPPPSQGFRSSPGPNAGALDHEFEAFQAGLAGPPQPEFLHLPPHLARHPPPPQFAHAPQGPDWASDFQRLNITASQPPPIHQHQPPVSHTASWHHEFQRQQAPSVQAPSFQQNTSGGMSGYSMGGYGASSFQQRPAFGAMNGNAVSEVAQGKQRVQDQVPAFDDAAFDRAFAQAHMDMIEETKALNVETDAGSSVGMTTEQLERMNRELRELTVTARLEQLAEVEDPALVHIRHQRPSVYAVLRIRSAIDLGKTRDALTYLMLLKAQEPLGLLTEDASEARWVVDGLQKIVEREAPQEIKTEAETLIKSINERLMSTYPLLATRAPISQDNIWEELEAAGYTRSPEPEQIERMEQQPEQQKEEQPLQYDDDEMAETAGRLLERVADNTSEKFQNSQFLELMRRLRDREVRVEGDKMVEVSSTQPPTSSPSQQQPQKQLQSSTGPTKVPGVDPQILDHAATDFDMPVFSEDGDEEYATLSRQVSKEPVTDEISDQFSYYNVNSSYHR